MKNLFLLVFGLALLTGCNTQTPATTDDRTVATPDRNAAPGASEGEALLDGTVDAVRANNGDLTALSPSVATSNIDSWIDYLDDVDGADKVTGNLEVLQEELRSGGINGPKTGMLLITLAEDTKQVVGAGNAATNALVSSLRSAGEKLTDAAVGESGLLGETLKAIRGKAADITTLPASAAVSNIDSWIQKLGTVDGTDEIVEDLRELRTELGEPSIDGDEVAELLKELAEATRGVAGNNTSLGALAYALEAGYWRLEAKD